MGTNELLITVSVTSGLFAGIGTAINVFLTHRRDRRAEFRSSFDEMRALKEEYEQQAKALQQELANLRAEVADLRERSKRLEQENIDLRVQVALLRAGQA